MPSSDETKTIVLRRHISFSSPSIIMSELRQDIISGDWVILAPGRAARPKFLDEPKKPRKASSKKHCPFEDLQASGNWPPIFVYPEKHLLDGKWEVAVIPNKFPALVPAKSRAIPFVHGIYHGKTGVGAHQLVITRDHAKGFADLSPARAAKVFEIIQACHTMASNDKHAEYVSSFHNWGSSSGASIGHPHYQVLTLPIVPAHTVHSLKGAKRYFAKHHRCVRCDIITYEKRKKVRVIEENQDAIAFAPYASKYALEVSVLPKKHAASFRDTSPRIMRNVALLLQSVMKRIRKYANDPDLNFYVHDVPLDHETRGRNKYPYHHWHIEVIPKVSTTAGFELSTWIDINTIDPDHAAAIVRGE